MRGDTSPSAVHVLFILSVTVATLSVISFLETTAEIDLALLQSFPVLIHCQTLDILPRENITEPVQVRLGQDVRLKPLRHGDAVASVQPVALLLPTGHARLYGVGDHSCSGSGDGKEREEEGGREEGGLTVIVSVNGYICSTEEKQRLVDGVARLMRRGWRKRLDMGKLLVSWSPGNDGVTVGVESFMREVLERNGYKRTPIGVVVHKKGHPMNSLALAGVACTRSVLHLEAAELERFPLEDVHWAYRGFKRLFDDRIVGLDCASRSTFECGSRFGSFFVRNNYIRELFGDGMGKVESRVVGSTADLQMGSLFRVVATALSETPRGSLFMPATDSVFQRLNHSVVICVKSCIDPGMKRERSIQARVHNPIEGARRNKRIEASQRPAIVHTAGHELQSGLSEELDIAVIRGISEDGFQRAYVQLLRAESHALPCVHVLVPFGDNASPRVLIRAVNSVLSQVYVKKTLWMVADGNDSRDTLAKLCGEFQFNTNVSTYAVHATLNSTTPIACMATKSLSAESKGSAFAKYLGFRRIQAKIFIDPNDIILVLDGDDYLRGRLAISTLVDEYRRRNCWCSWGGMRGLYAEQGGPLPIEAGKTLNPRRSKWVFTHPRTLKVALAARIKAKDFQDREGQWVKKATDVGFIYRMIELAGQRHACYIERDLYQYTAKTRPKSLDAVSKEQKAEYMDHFQNMEPSQPLKSLSDW